MDYIHSLGIDMAGVVGDGATRSAVVCLFPYYSGYREGNISIYAHSVDYHIIVGAYLKKIAEFIKDSFPGTETSYYVDKGAPNNKQMAYSAGLGFYGRNSLIINEKYGSYVFIGYVMTNLALKPDTPILKTCMECGECEKFCPADAITREGFLPDKCASKITQTSGELTEEQEELIKKSGYIWGCDICQKVCPHNKNASHTNIHEFKKEILQGLSSNELEGISNSQFKEKYGNRSFAWKGRRTIARNAKILEGLKNDK